MSRTFGCTRRQCGSWPYSALGSGRKSAAVPRLSGVHVLPRSRDSNTPPPERPMYRCFASNGSTLIECSVPPSGGASCKPPIHLRRAGFALTPSTPCHVLPPSSEANRACGDVPAYQRPGSVACPGVSQNTWLTDSPGPPGGALAKAGGVAASCHEAPRSSERKTVGPRWPARTAARSVRPSRGSSTAWFTTWPRKCGPSIDQLRRRPSALRKKRPLRVPTRTRSTLTLPATDQNTSFLRIDLIEPKTLLRCFSSASGSGAGASCTTYLGSVLEARGGTVAERVLSVERLAIATHSFGRPMRYFANSSTAWSFISEARMLKRSTSNPPTFLVTIFSLPLSWSPSTFA